MVASQKLICSFLLGLHVLITYMNGICMQEWSSGLKSLPYTLGCTSQGSVSNLSGSGGLA